MTERRLAPSAPLSPEQSARVEAAVGMVRRAAQKFGARYRGLITEDELVSSGYDALVTAGRAYDPTHAAPFEGFAWTHVYGAMMDAVRRAHRDRRRARKIAEGAACEYLEVQRERGDVFHDTAEDDARHLRAVADGAVAAMAAALIGGMLSAATADDVAVSRETALEAKAALDAALGELPDRERQLVELRYFEERELVEIAKTLNVSYATVRRYHGGTLERLGTRMRALGVTRAPREWLP